MNTQISMRRVNRTSRTEGATPACAVADAGTPGAPLSVLMAEASVEAVHRERSHQIGQDRDAPPLVHDDSFQDTDGMRSAEGFEVADREQVHVGRVVPFKGQGRGHWHAPPHDLQPVSPVTKVWESDDPLAP